MKSLHQRLGQFLRSILLGLLGLASAPAVAADVPIVAWTFDRVGDLEGWRPNGHLAGVTVTNGELRCRAVGSDPILELTAPLDFAATPWQFIEVRLKADHDGTAEIFWSNTREGRYGGFSQDKTTRFAVTGDSAWHTYRLFPFWHAERSIVRLRFDLYDGTTFALDALRIGALEPPPSAARPEFVFTNGAAGWQIAGAGEMMFVTNAPPHPSLSPDGGEGARRAGEGEAALLLKPAARETFWLAPPVNLSADRESFVSLKLAASGGKFTTVLFATDASPGLHRVPFPLEASAQPRIYNLDLLAAKDWRGRIVALGLQPTDEPGATAQLFWFKVGDAPQGPPQLVVNSFALDEALPRVGRPAVLRAIVANTGATTVTNLRATLQLPDGVRMSGDATVEARVPKLAFDEEAAVEWRIEAARPVNASAAVIIDAANATLVRAEARLAFTPRPDVARASYVPEPKPVRGPFEVGAYYFPGWKSRSQWQPIESFPERKPVLGWYREGDPEVADWQIKWAVEHGITFFAYDWYWSQGARQLEHGLHDGFFKARYRHLLKFCLLWANHNAPKTSSHEDCLAVTRYWVENYFRRPEHLMIDGKPVMIIFSPHRLTEDLGSAGVKRAFEAMREECRRAGLNGLYLLACVADAGGARVAATEGYDAITAYNWPGLGMKGDSLFAPFAGLLEGYRRNWEHLATQSPIPMMLPVCGGWDSRPWHGANNLVRFGRTPDLFREHLADARRFLETHTSEGGVARRPASRNEGSRSSPLRVVLVEAWNEWGEGSYIEPHQEFGFGYPDAIRQVFTAAPAEHLDLAPADVGLGPYELPAEPPGRTEWSFAVSDEGWGSGMNLANIGVANGVLAAQTSGNDPAFFGPPMQATADRFTTFVVRMKLTPSDGRAFADSAQIFWKTTRLAESEATSRHFKVVGDGQWHEYRARVADNLRWRGVVSRLRFDPCSRSGVTVELDSLGLAR